LDLDTLRTNVALDVPPVEEDELQRTIARRHHLREEQVLVRKSALGILKSYLTTCNGSVGILVPDYFEFHGMCTHPVDILREDGCRAVRLPSGLAGVILSNPNNPTGAYHDLQPLIFAAGSVPVLVDEAYVEFVGEQHSLVRDGALRDNLIVIRTFSKAYGLNDEKVAYAIGNPALLERIDCEEATPSARLRAQALFEKADLATVRREVRRRRARLNGLLESISCEVVPSVTNFVMARHREGLFTMLSARDVCVVSLDQTPGLIGQGYVRIAVGSDLELDELQRRLYDR
jgi:histidinol-phosphate aminotransferase